MLSPRAVGGAACDLRSRSAGASPGPLRAWSGGRQAPRHRTRPLSLGCVRRGDDPEPVGDSWGTHFCCSSGPLGGDALPGHPWHVPLPGGCPCPEGQAWRGLGQPGSRASALPSEDCCAREKSQALKGDVPGSSGSLRRPVRSAALGHLSLLAHRLLSPRPRGCRCQAGPALPLGRDLGGCGRFLSLHSPCSAWATKERSWGEATPRAQAGTQPQGTPSTLARALGPWLRAWPAPFPPPPPRQLQPPLSAQGLCVSLAASSLQC